MTIMMQMDLPMPRGEIERVSAELGTHENPPDGLVVHVATETAGGVHVTDIWESEAAFEKFRDSVLVPAMQKFLADHNMTPESAPQPKIEEAFDVVKGR